jgi:hypothetical protein
MNTRQLDVLSRWTEWSSGMNTRQLDVLSRWTELTDRSPLIASLLVGLVVALSVAPIVVVVMGRTEG